MNQLLNLAFRAFRLFCYANLAAALVSLVSALALPAVGVCSQFSLIEPPDCTASFAEGLMQFASAFAVASVLTWVPLILAGLGLIFAILAVRQRISVNSP